MARKFDDGYLTGYADGREDRELDRPRFTYPPPAAGDLWHSGYDQGYAAGYSGNGPARPPKRRMPKSLTAAERREIVNLITAGTSRDRIVQLYGISAGSVTTLVKQESAAGRGKGNYA